MINKHQSAILEVGMAGLCDLAASLITAVVRFCGGLRASGVPRVQEILQENNVRGPLSASAAWLIPHRQQPKRRKHIGDYFGLDHSDASDEQQKSRKARLSAPQPTLPVAVSLFPTSANFQSHRDPASAHQGPNPSHESEAGPITSTASTSSSTDSNSLGGGGGGGSSSSSSNTGSSSSSSPVIADDPLAVSKCTTESRSLEDWEQPRPQPQSLSLESLDGLPLSVEDFDLLRDLTFIDFLSLIPSSVPYDGRDDNLTTEQLASRWDLMIADHIAHVTGLPC